MILLSAQAPDMVVTIEYCVARKFLNVKLALHIATFQRLTDHTVTLTIDYRGTQSAPGLEMGYRFLCVKRISQRCLH